MRMVQLVYALTLAFFFETALATEVVLESDEQRKIMIELFTSQGCSSCPPAERYLNEFTEHKQLWSRYIPLAFHVDYWDYIGWKDRFATPAYTARQRHYGRVLRARTIYTPEFFVNGKEWRRGLFQSEVPQEVSKVGRLKVKVRGQNLQASFSPLKVGQGPLDLNIAVLGMGLKTRILAGENEGRHSRHEFVVLGHKRVQGQGQWQVMLPQSKEGIQPQRRALAVWVSQVGHPVPIQVVGGFI